MKWQPEPFTKQDIELVLAYNRIRKFEITRKTLGAGAIINVRETLSLDNSLIEYMVLGGVPRDHGGVMKNFEIIGRKYYLKDYEIVSTLVGHNRSFHYNSKTKKFFDRLLKAGRFQQHCILKNKSYHPIAYESFCDYVKFIHEDDRLFEESMRFHDYP